MNLKCRVARFHAVCLIMILAAPVLFLPPLFGGDAEEEFVDAFHAFRHPRLKQGINTEVKSEMTFLMVGTEMTMRIEQAYTQELSAFDPDKNEFAASRIYQKVDSMLVVMNQEINFELPMEDCEVTVKREESGASLTLETGEEEAENVVLLLSLMERYTWDEMDFAKLLPKGEARPDLKWNPDKDLVKKLVHHCIADSSLCFYLRGRNRGDMEEGEFTFEFPDFSCEAKLTRLRDGVAEIQVTFSGEAAYTTTLPGMGGAEGNATDIVGTYTFDADLAGGLIRSAQLEVEFILEPKANRNGAIEIKVDKKTTRNVR